MKKKTTETFRLSDLAKMKKAKDHRLYQETVDSAPIGDGCKRLFLKKNGSNPRPRNRKWQEEFIQMLESQKEEKDALIENMRIDLTGLGELMNMAKAEYEDVLAELKESELKLKKAQIRYEQFRKKLTAQINEKKMLEQEIANEHKRLEQMEQILLLHPSASVTSLDKRCGHTIVCTAFDQMDCCGVEDLVEDTTILDLFEENVPEEIKDMFSSEREFYSAIEYTKLALVYFVEEDKAPKLLYDSNGITELLKLQGVL